MSLPSICALLHIAVPHRWVPPCLPKLPDQGVIRATGTAERQDTHLYRPESEAQELLS